MAVAVLQRLIAHADTRPDEPALREVDVCRGPGRLMSYRELAGAIGSVAATIDRELPAGAAVMLCYPNRAECVVGFFGVLAAGRTVFPVHPNLTDAELKTAAERSRARGVIGDERAIRVLGSSGLVEIGVPAEGGTSATPESWPVCRNTSEGARLLLQSSGTTGQPKIVQRSGPSLDAVARNVADSARLTPDDRVLGLVPACHSYGVENVMLGPLYAGASVHLCRRMDSAMILDQLAAGGITVFPGVPSTFEMLAQVGDGANSLPSLRSAYSAGSNLPLPVFEAFERSFGVRVGQLYGMTEIGSVTFNDASADGHDPMSVGEPMDGVRIRIVDPDTRKLDSPLPAGVDGEVAVSAPSMLTGYLNDTDGTCETPPTMRDEYFLTGDRGHLDDRGRLTITGRLKLIVDVGGLKVNLLEVEQVLAGHEAVSECLINPVAVSETVSRLKAFVIPASPDEPPSPESLRSYLRTRLAAHKVPRAFEIRDSLPRSATGKIRRIPL